MLTAAFRGTCVVCRILEAVIVIGIFLRLGSFKVALSTSIAVVAYFLFTVAVTKWRCVATAEISVLFFCCRELRPFCFTEY